MLPPTGVRRLVSAPLVVVMAGALAMLAPPLAVLSLAFHLVRRRTERGPQRAKHMRALRVVCFALVWFLGETAALTVCLCLWIVSGFGGRLDTEPYRSRHYAIMRWFLGVLFRAAQQTCGLRVEVDGPPQTETGDIVDRGIEDRGIGDRGIGDRPLIVLSRHGGPGDSLLLVHHLLTTCGRRPRVIMKASLQLDPSLDVVANRLPNAFVHRRRGRIRHTAPLGGHPPPKPPGHSTAEIRRLAASLGPRDALVLFPEGGNWTPQRWRRAVARLRRRGQSHLAERAVAMPRLLAPRSGGAIAAITAAPAADVIFVAHTGLDRLVSVRDVWRSLSADMVMRARWWRVPAAEVPRAAARDAQTAWLYDWWERMHAWITSQDPAPAPTSVEAPRSL